ncbi:hypothetical protein D9615_007517 [Tricholomella constricta]|uniref:Peptidase M48 domain-containing protein n=1 Tax=Tricholomella constricta TaxID=117010 RepID=A0A8H5H7Z0_9AGAR|nr:hypothetical protein D9615_007517 [Tricholomella constricta]
MYRATAASLLRHPSTVAPRLPRYPVPRLNSLPRPTQPTCRRHFSSSRPAHARIEYVRFDGQPPGRRPQNDNRLKIVVGLGALGVVYYLAQLINTTEHQTSLEQVPETGRWRFMNTGPKFEEKFGKMAREQTLEEYAHLTLPPHHPLSRHVRRVVSRILSASNLGHIRGDNNNSSSQYVVPPPLLPVPYHGESGIEIPWDPDARMGRTPEGGETGQEREWEVIVVNDPKMINAQAVPGLIVVYTGILPVCKDEQGLSAVLAHEIGHVVARHSAERISSQTITFTLLFMAQLLGLDFGMSNAVQSLLFQLPNSRTQELEADKIGMTLMARACFDPRGSVEMFERMGQLEAKISKVNLDFLATHPSSATRVEKLEKLLPDAYAVLAANPECAAMQDRLNGFREAEAAALGGSGSGLGSGLGLRDAGVWT